MRTKTIFVMAVFLLMATALQGCTSGGNKMSENQIVVFETNRGNIELEIFNSTSPITGNNFLKLVGEGFYDGTKFHRVIGNFMIQGGDPYSKDDNKQHLWGTGGSKDTIKDEFIEGHSNVKGTIAMANSGPNSGSSQFFINLVNNTYLDWNKPPTQSKHPVFGEVVSGMDIVETIGKVKVDGSDKPVEAVVIEKAYVK